MGYEVIVAVDGINGLELFNIEAPDLVITDGKMPRMDGYELCRRVRAISRVPIILITGNDLSDEEREVISSTGVVLVLKPFDLDKLKAQIDELLT